MRIINIAGAGLTGCTIAQQLVERFQDVRVNVYETRHEIAGNLADEWVDGVLVHKYGPHLLHYDSEIAHAWFSRFAELVPYEHRVQAVLADGRYVPFPINTDTLAALGAKLPDGAKREVKTSDDVFFNAVGDKLADIFFRPYTRRMWNRDATEIDALVGARVPIRHSSDNRYFTNEYQVLPKFGYSHMLGNAIDHPRINVVLSADPIQYRVESSDLIFTSEPIDSYFDYCYGELPYRSVKFTLTRIPQQLLHSSATSLNFTTQPGIYSRLTIWERLPHANSVTHSQMPLVTVEEPCDGDPYYPVLTQESKSMYELYSKLAQPNVKFVGRLGKFQYIDMAPAVLQAIAEVRKVA